MTLFDLIFFECIARCISAHMRLWFPNKVKLSVQSRFGWAWMRKSSQRDTIVLLGNDLSVACNNGQYAKGSGAPPTPTSYRFKPMDLLEAARSSHGVVGGRRLNTGQLELRIRAKEKRRAKRINGCTSDTLGQSSYLVQYSTAPLPLFYTDASADGNCLHRFFLKTSMLRW